MVNVKELVNSSLFPKLNNLPKWMSNLIISMLEKLFCEETYNKISKGKGHLEGLEFTDNLLSGLGISSTVQVDQLKNIPTNGKVIIIANHITGMQDTFGLVQLIAGIREDSKVKIVMNDMMSGVKNGFTWSIPVNIHGSIPKSSLKEIYTSLDNEEAIIIFPSGYVNRYSFLNGLKDIPWKASFLKIAQKSKAPVLPIKISGRNSIGFYVLSKILPSSLSGLLLPREFAKAGQRKPLNFNIGKAIPASSFSDKKITTQEYLEMFYKHLYLLGKNDAEILKTEVTIGRTKNKTILKQELTQAQYLGDTNNGKKIYLADPDKSPFLLRELGRAREISFRAIGGGTGQERDNDSYDKYYKHLIIWDDYDLEVVGAYRIGECKTIVEKMGKEGLYTSNQCNFTDHFKDYCENTMEFGRSFVQPKYWGSRAFDSLWQAITVYLAHNPHIHYGYGIVTINANTPPKATAALVYFYSHYFSCETKMMQAKEPYIMKEEDKKEFENLFNHLTYKEGFRVLKKYLKDLDTVVPTLFKQYIELFEEGAVRYFDFSVNEKLFGVVEGFMIADARRMKKSVRERNLKNFNKSKTIDTLTKLYSRSHFSDMVSEIIKHQRKSDINFVLVIIKVDNIDDVTDKTLVKISTTLKKSLRDNDIIAKWDNDEFIFILKNLTYDDAMNVLSKLKESITTATCSFGATAYIAGEEIEETFIRAKDALSEALDCKVNKIIIQK